VAGVALLVVAWLGVMERDWRLQQRGVEALQPGSSAADLARAETDLRRAGLLNPDTAPDVNLALVHQARGEPARALALIGDVVEREPDNLTAWATLALLARSGGDAEAAERAFEARRRLDPLNAR
jgi:tetratricopeptide (TPR) repeat protein